MKTRNGPAVCCACRHRQVNSRRKRVTTKSTKTGFRFGRALPPPPPTSKRIQRQMVGKAMTVNKVTWAQVGRVTEPGRYMYRFGWLTITAPDLEIWQRFPNAAFTLFRTSTGEVEDDFRLGAFELPETPDDRQM